MLERPNIDVQIFIEGYIKYIKKLNLEASLSAAAKLGNLLCRNELGIYSLNDLELHLIDSTLSELGGRVDELKYSLAEDGLLFLATELYSTGGHSRLLERLSGFLELQPDLLLTKRPEDNILAREKKFFSKIFYFEENIADLLDKIYFLTKVMLRNKCVVVNTHPDDIIGIICCGVAKAINQNLQIHFINHADHTFTYGSSLADVWYELSDYGKHIDRLRGLKAAKSFLGIPIVQSEIVRGRYEFKNGDLILSAGAHQKYRPTKTLSILPLVDCLLSKYNCSKMQIIGVDWKKDYWWWMLKIKYGSRLILSKALPYEEYMEVTAQAKLYVDSHPFPGGTAFAEQFLDGRLCTGLVSPYSGYTPAEILKMNSPAEVLQYVVEATRVDVRPIVDDLVRVNGIDSVKERFLKSMTMGIHAKIDVGSSFASIVPVVNTKIYSIPPGFRFFNTKLFLNAWKAATLQAFVRFYAEKNIRRVLKIFPQSLASEIRKKTVQQN